MPQATVIAELGELHHGRRRLQPPSATIRQFYARAEGVLKFPLQEFTFPEIQAIAGGLTEAMSRYRYTCYACAITPDHVHLLIRKHKDKSEQMIENVQESCHKRRTEETNGGMRTVCPTTRRYRRGWRVRGTFGL